MGTWWSWVPDRVSLLPCSWKVTGLLPWHDDTGRPANEASWAILTTSPEGSRACMSGLSKTRWVKTLLGGGVRWVAGLQEVVGGRTARTGIEEPDLMTEGPLGCKGGRGGAMGATEHTVCWTGGVGVGVTSWMRGVLEA